MSIFSGKGDVAVLLHSLFSPKVARDPRFDDLSGEYNPEVFDKTYQFLDDIRAREKEVSSVRRFVRIPGGTGAQVREAEGSRVNQFASCVIIGKILNLFSIQFPYHKKLIVPIS